MPLGVVLCLVLLKYLPGTADWELARLAGIVSFGYAAFLALRLIQGEDAVQVNGWSELRASPVEVFGALGAAGASALLMTAVIFNGALMGATPAQVVVAFGAAVALAGGSAAILYTCIMVRTRWNQTSVERRDASGRITTIAWDDVVKVQGRWTGITITGADKRRVSFSPLQSGAAQLATFARKRVQRNVKAAAPALWGQG